VRSFVALGVIFGLAPVLGAQTVLEPRSGVSFERRRGELTLTGVALRTKTLLKVKVYAIGLYLADTALASSLAAKRGKPKTPAFYREILNGDFAKAVQLQFTRDLSAEQVRDAFRDRLKQADRAHTEAFVGYFGAVKSGQDCLLEWAPGGVLRTTVAGESKPDIADPAFASAVFGIWLGDKPIQDDIKADLGKLF
jgi:hypothetical protein